MLCRLFMAFLAALTLCGCPTASPRADADATIDGVDVPSIATLCAAALSPGCWGDPSVPPSCRCRAMLSHIRPDIFPLVAACLAQSSGSEGLCPDWIAQCGMVLQTMGSVQP